jgi:hypothetical protein
VGAIAVFVNLPIKDKEKNGINLSLKYYLADSNGIISAFLKAPTTDI